MPERARLEALALAGDLPGVLLDAKRLAASAPGAHGRRRAGQGEAFWQYRDHRPEDGARLVDWRRSARGDRYYVREREREAAQTAWFWLDPEPGFNWSSDRARPTKLYRARTLALALAILLARGGERVGALGQPSRAGARAPERLAHDFLAPVGDVDALGTVRCEHRAATEQQIGMTQIMLLGRLCGSGDSNLRGFWRHGFAFATSASRASCAVKRIRSIM